MDTAGVVAAAGAATALIGIGIVSVRIRANRAEMRLWNEATAPPLDQRLNDLAKTMTEAAQSLSVVTVEMDLRRAEVERLRREQHAAWATKALTDEQLSAIRSQLATVLRPETDRGIRWAVVIGVLSFIAGVGATIAVTLYVHP